MDEQTSTNIIYLAMAVMEAEKGRSRERQTSERGVEEHQRTSFKCKSIRAST